MLTFPKVANTPALSILVRGLCESNHLLCLLAVEVVRWSLAEEDSQAKFSFSAQDKRRFSLSQMLIHDWLVVARNLVSSSGGVAGLLRCHVLSLEDAREIEMGREVCLSGEERKKRRSFQLLV